MGIAVAYSANFEATNLGFSSPNITNHAKGLLAEKTAATFLKLHGYNIVGQRIKYKCGEIDILGKKGEEYYIFEVKFRKNFANSMECISTKSLKRSANAFFTYASENNIEYEQIHCKAIVFRGVKPEIIDIDAVDFE